MTGKRFAEPDKNPINGWGLGLFLPVLAIAHGIRVVVVKQTSIVGKGGRWDFFGIEAVIVGLFYIASGFAIHFFYFQSVKEYPRNILVAGKVISITLMALLVVALLVRKFL